ncbi:transglycosylase domain-containing protein [Streptomyces sp. NPDC001793]|uniref:transglycosylase domain-containing protein n=1 Tax=Streptomyces sp. NPDC001793 TaxID=3154657 RepID=UPI00331B5132
MPSWKQVASMCVAVAGLVVGVAGVGLALVQVPNVNQAAKSQNNVYLWADGKVMARDGETNRQLVDISEIPLSMQNAVISAENASFRQDHGVDPMGILRALFNMARGGDTQGGSTITQQYVKNAMLSQEQTLDRKFKELFISIKVGWKQTKDQILAGYLNTSYFGRGAYGIQAAAQAYFGKDASKLNPSESAFLAATLKGANLYDPAGGIGANATPALNTQRAKERWSWILDRMVSNGHLKPAEEAQWKAKGFPMPQQPKAGASKGGQIGYLIDVAKKYVLKHRPDIPEARFDKGGYTIRTTFDQKKTKELAAAVKKVDDHYIDPKKRPEKDKYVQFGAASVVPGDGKIVALYGGDGYDKGHFSNNADTYGVPVGSTWKPFVLAAAMKYGKAGSDQPLSPDSKYNGDDHLKVKNADGNFVLKKDNTPFYQVNESPYPWGYITLRKAMEQSVNTPFVQLGMDVGMDKVRDMAQAAGIAPSSFDRNLNPSFALGTSTPSAIRMADAYATFAASGTQAEPYSVTKVISEGKELSGFDKPTPHASAIDANIANNVTDVLENVVKNGTGQQAKKLDMPAAGKTGTTDENKSAWFVGYTKQLSTAITMFREDAQNPRQLSMNGVGGFDSIHGGALPTEVWTQYMLQAMQGLPPLPFPAADPIGQVINEPGMPSPTPTPTPSTASPTPSGSPSSSATPSQSASPTPTQSCSPWDIHCKNHGGGPGGGTGGGPGGPGGDTGGTPPTTPDPTSGGNSGGGIFGGPTGGESP